MKVGDLVRFKPNSFYSAYLEKSADVGLVIKVNKPTLRGSQLIHALWNGETKHEVYYSYELEVIT